MNFQYKTEWRWFPIANLFKYPSHTYNLLLCTARRVSSPPTYTIQPGRPQLREWALPIRSVTFAHILINSAGWPCLLWLVAVTTTLFHLEANSHVPGLHLVARVNTRFFCEGRQTLRLVCVAWTVYFTINGANIDIAWMLALAITFDTSMMLNTCDSVFVELDTTHGKFDKCVEPLMKWLVDVSSLMAVQFTLVETDRERTEN